MSSNQCLTDAADGFRMVECNDLPEQYWGVLGINAVDNIPRHNYYGTVDTPIEPLNTPADITLAKAPTPTPDIENFEGHISYDGIQIKLTLTDVLFILLLVYFAFKLL